MSSYLIQQAKIKVAEEKNKLPDWVTGKNASYDVYLVVQKLKTARLVYINKHAKVHDFKVKKTYQITVSEVAVLLKMNDSTLYTASYAKPFKAYLKRVNDDLARLKEDRVRKYQKNKAKGAIHRNKDELVEENKQLNAELKKLKERKNKEVLADMFNSFSPEMRKLLFDHNGLIEVK